MHLTEDLFSPKIVRHGCTGRYIESENAVVTWCVGHLVTMSYPEVYDMFKDFKYNPIEDARFAIFDGIDSELDENERKVLDLVMNTFGEYGGRALERITHNEEPWKEARKGYDDSIPSNEIISMKNIEAYYTAMNAKYDFSSETGLRKYINAMMR